MIQEVSPVCSGCTSEHGVHETCRDNDNGCSCTLHEHLSRVEKAAMGKIRQAPQQGWQSGTTVIRPRPRSETHVGDSMPP